MSRSAPNLATSASPASRCSPAARLDNPALGGAGAQEGGGATAAERVLASELAGRDDSCDALSMMVGSMLRMVQAGKGSDSRWQSS